MTYYSTLQGVGDLMASSMKNFAHDSRHLILLKGFALQGLYINKCMHGVQHDISLFQR